MYQYRGCLYPLLSVFGVLLILAAMDGLTQFENAVWPVVNLVTLEGYPNVSLQSTHHIVKAALKWFSLSYFMWLVVFITIIFCGYIIVRITKELSTTERYIVRGIFFAILISCSSILFYTIAIAEKPLMPVEHILKNIYQVSSGLVRLTSYNMALGIIAMVSLLATNCLLLVPAKNTSDINEKMRFMTYLMYNGAVLFVIWVSQAEEMYRFSATLFVKDIRDVLFDVAPSFSLVIGIIASTLLAASYFSSYLWLQGRFKVLPKDKSDSAPANGAETPGTILKKHWSSITAILLPIFPGILGNVLTQVSAIG
ncbi:hypothetical protein [Aliikangiella coralliicola]|uniref:Uncharacterized protein n=1 Tax=Aliikangiella coralliicola TaxID=2592383 RepID=A0A545UC37_9GAMM|nr:hypothetical protein [Aliikangiella coralliicola]TQV87026.1 hypothetical protein FLL46_14565 [Aliikangiella coralliicola]